MAVAGEYRARRHAGRHRRAQHPLRLQLAVPERSAAGLQAWASRSASASKAIPPSIRAASSGSARRSPKATARCRSRPSCPIPAACCGPARSRRPKSSSSRNAGRWSFRVDAVVSFAGVEKVLTVEDGKAREQRIRTGRRDGDRVEIARRPASGDLVIIAARRPGRRRRRARVSTLSRCALAAICIERPVFAAMLILALVVVGAASFFRLGIDRFPAVDLPHGDGAHDPARRLGRGDRDAGLRRRSKRRSTRVEGINELRSVSAPVSRW